MVSGIKILAFSDIHVDVAESFPIKKYLSKLSQFFTRFGELDLLICAGDVSPHLDEFENTLEYLRATVKASHYLVVPGNHDIWIEEIVDNCDESYSEIPRAR